MNDELNNLNILMKEKSKIIVVVEGRRGTGFLTFWTISLDGIRLTIDQVKAGLLEQGD